MSKVKVAIDLINLLQAVTDLSVQLGISAQQAQSLFDKARSEGRELTMEELIAQADSAHDAIDNIPGVD